MRFFVLFFFALIVPYVSADSIKIGYIDTQQVVNNLTKYKIGKSTIAKEFESKKEELLDLYNHIELLRANLEMGDQTLNEVSYKKELNKFLELELSFKKETEYWQATINQKQLDLLQQIELIINQAIKEFSLDENYDLILYENAAFVSSNIDISDKIISKIENQTQ